MDTFLGVYILFGVPFDRGEFVAFIDQSGVGKAAIVLLLTRLYEPDSGEIRVDGCVHDTLVAVYISKCHEATG